MKKIVMAIFVSCFCLSLTACGVKGALYQNSDQQPVRQQNAIQ